ncbi:MAG: hypothetical protein D6802_07490 [Ardenticatenia bacterium]|nr:MAG: hypothetical protein D6802_07490 [Ardenticatenia bacterium]
MNEQELRALMRDITLEQMQTLPSATFKQMIALLLRSLGFRADPDADTEVEGVDMLAWDVEGKPWVVLLRREIAVLDEPIVAQFVRDLHETYGIERGIMVTCGTLTPEARAWTTRAHVYLWGADRLQKMLQLAGGKRWKIEAENGGHS